MNLNPESGISTEQFIKSLTTPTLSSLSDEIRGYNPPPEPGFEGQPLIQPLPMQQQHQPAPVQVAPVPQADDLLAEAYQTTKESARREQILKENYLKAEQRAAHKEKEGYTKDLQLAQFFLKNAIEDGDSDLQTQMHGKISELQSQITKHDIEYNNFLENYQNILDDKPKVFDYAPTYQEEETAYQESPTRNTFRKENPWYDFEAATYNPSLVEKAVEIEQKMLNEYQLKNMNNYLETPYYFEDLKGRLFKEFGVEAPQTQPQQQYPKNQADWQTFQNQQQMGAQPNPFVPQQIPQLNNTQSPYPAMPVQQQPQQYAPPSFPQGQQQPYAYGPQAAPVTQSYGPPVAPVRHGMGMPQQPYQTDETMFSQKAFEMFQNSLNPTIAPQLANLNQDQKMQLFNAAIKNKGKF